MAQSISTLPNDKTKTPKIDLAKAIRLRFEKNLSYQEIANVFGCRKESVWGALKPFRKILEHPQATNAHQQNRAQIYTALEKMVVSKLANGDQLEKASANNLAYLLRQLYDIMRLETGQSTENIAYKEMSDDLAEVEAELAEIQGESKDVSELPEYEQIESDLADLSGA